MAGVVLGSMMKGFRDVPAKPDLPQRGGPRHHKLRSICKELESSSNSSTYANGI